MEWDGRALATIGDLSDTILAIARDDDQDAADGFMAQYRSETQHADINVGYLSGYYDSATMAKVQRMFGVRHPIFDTRADVSPAEAFAAGGEAMLGDEHPRTESPLGAQS